MVSSKAIASTVLVLRMITLLSLLACVVLVLRMINLKNVHAYRYVLATALIGLAYTLLQIPLSIYHVRKYKRLIRSDLLVTSDFYADKVISFLLATGVGAGFAVGFESRRVTKELFVLLTQLELTNSDERRVGQWRSENLTFFYWGNIATGLLFIGFISMALIQYSHQSISIPSDQDDKASSSLES